MKEKLLTVVLACILVLALWYLMAEAWKCSQRDGVLVKGVFWLECVEKR